MRFTDGKITSFSSLLGSIFYDWGFGGGTGPWLHKDDEDYFWINKTAIFKEEDQYYFTYKTETMGVDEKVFAKLSLFYDLYADDAEFQAVMDIFEDHWHNQEFLYKEGRFYLGKNCEVVEVEGQFILKYNNNQKTLSKETVLKLRKFHSLLIN